MARMTRLDFLKKVFGTGMLLSVPPFTILTKDQKDLYQWTESAIPVYMYESYIRGFQYYEGPDIIGSMKSGDELDLIREPDNKYDGFATAVFKGSSKLGYLPRDENISIANLLDSGMLLRCKAKEVSPDKPLWEAALVRVELLVPDNEVFRGYLEKARSIRSASK